MKTCVCVAVLVCACTVGVANDVNGAASKRSWPPSPMAILDVDIFDGQGGVVDREDDPGAVTLVNTNNTDFDTMRDDQDTDGVPGEIDLMQFVIKQPVPDLGGSVTLEKPADTHVKVYTSSSKGQGTNLAGTSLSFPTGSLPKTLWIEVLQKGVYTFTATYQSGSTSDDAVGKGIVIEIKRGEDVISDDEKTSVMVGHNIDLVASEDLPGGLAITTRQWTIPGEKVKSYTMNFAAGEKEDLTAEDLDDNDASFYWIAKPENGFAVVEYAVVVQNNPANVNLKQKARFFIDRPTVDHFTSDETGLNPKVDVRVLDADHKYLVYGRPWGDPWSPGVTWEGKAAAPAGGAGKIALLQLIKTERRYTAQDSTSWVLTSGDNYVLDDGTGSILYDATHALKDIAANGQQTTKSYDSPLAQLTQTMRARSASEQFKTYLVYKPDGANAIWVTLSVLQWSWSGEASSDDGVTWTRDAGASNAGNGADSTSLPLWDDHATNLTYQQEQ